MHAALTVGILAELRTLVVSAGTRRAIPTTCHIGHPGGAQSRFPHGLVDDPSLRADLVERAIDGLRETDRACAWVSRGGELELNDADAEWLAASWSAFGRHGLVLPAFFVVNRNGWVDLVSGERRQWTRVRNRPRACG